MKFRIDLPFKVSTNAIYAGIHWRKRKSHKDQMLLACIGMKQLKPVDKPVDIRMDFYFKSHALDSSNCSYLAKLLEDCLVKYGVLKDDSRKYVRDVTYCSHKGKDLYVEIEIT
jgi:hypothetical protein